MLNRRKLLTVGGAAAGGALLLSESLKNPSAAADGQPPIGDPHAHELFADSVRPHANVAAFSVPMPVPRVLAPFKGDPDVDFYRLPISPANVEVLPGVQTPLLTFGGGFVGPTIKAKTGRPVSVTFTNQLTEAANVHLHGGHVLPQHDGHPMDVIAPGGSRNYLYPNTQQGATLWYHDHSHHTEAKHVYHGMHGFYLIDDAAEASLGLPSGQYDVPIMLRDALIDANGNLVDGAEPDQVNTLLANGRPQPYFQVAARKYRFRLLNSAVHRLFTLNLGGVEMLQIATDGGLLPAPVPRTEIQLSAAERVEIVVDFSRFPVGTQLVLGDTIGPVLRFDVVRTAADDSRVPSTLRPLPALPPATVVRDIRLSFDVSGPVPVGLINGRPYDPNRADIQIKRGTTEIWNVINADPIEFDAAHNFHMHLVQFRVLSRDGGAPTLNDMGRKDTVSIPPTKSVRVQATFGDYLGRYAYHCHFLEHSALGMMAQMEIVA
jgi:FtsP/CotA-like multicopper oxidase with cupredoxin domain